MGSTNDHTDLQRKTKKKTISALPPPKDEIEIQVMEREVQETVRLLEGLKLGGKTNASSSPKTGMELASSSASASAATFSATRQLSRQQKQERELMQSLKQSLKQSQQHKSSTAMQSNTPPSLSSITTAASKNKNKSVVVASSSEKLARAEKLQHYVEQLRIRAANDLKVELSSLGLPDKGRKPDLINRLAEYYVSSDAEVGTETQFDNDNGGGEKGGDHQVAQPSLSSTLDRPISFAGIPRLSATAAAALHRAFGNQGENALSSPKPTPIQASAIPYLYHPPHPSALLHAPTGSGKTISYILPITETLWREVEDGNRGSTEDDNIDDNDMANGIAIILLPTRELAAQVAGVASVLAPPGMVRLIPRPMDLMRCWKDEVNQVEEYEYLQSIAKNGNNIVNVSTSNSSRKIYRPRIYLEVPRPLAPACLGIQKCQEHQPRSQRENNY